MEIGLATAIIAALTVIATIVSPIIALRVQRSADEEKEKRQRKLSIYKTLMTNRATRLSPVYVQALNMIDIEFTGSNNEEKAVRNAWRELLDLFGSYNTTQNAFDKVTDLTAVLLEVMGKCLGYEYDRVTIKKGAYIPEMHVDLEKDQIELRKALLNLLKGNGAKLPVAIFTQDFQPLAVNPITAQVAKVTQGDPSN